MNESALHHPETRGPTTVKDTKPLVDVRSSTACGADTPVDIAKAIPGFKGCNAASEKLPGLLSTINDGAITVKETEPEDYPENTGVKSALEAVLKINDTVGDGIMIVIAPI